MIGAQEKLAVIILKSDRCWLLADTLIIEDRRLEPAALLF